MKRLLVVLALSAVTAASARAQTVSVRPAGDLSSLPGVPFTVPIVADWSARADKLGSFAIGLTWDPTVLEYNGSAPGSFGSAQANIDVINGTLTLAGVNPLGASGAVTLINLSFTPLAASNTTVQLSVSELYSSGPTFADVLPSATTQNGLFCPARGFWGDPDLDRSVGSRDALIALSSAVGLDVSAFPQVGLADVDGDGSVQAKDALVILSYAVGLNVSAFRVSRVALGSCGTELTTAYAVTPNGDTLVAGDEVDVAFDLRATAGGAVRTIPDVFWKSSNPAVLLVLPTGTAVPVAPGVAVVTGKSGTRDSATATITVVAHRRVHYVSARAAQAANLLGTAAHPYDSLFKAERLMRSGDTIVVLPGRYQEGIFLDSAAVILGRPSGNDWPVLTGTQYQFGVTFLGTGRNVVHGLRLEGFSVGVSAMNADQLEVDSVRTFVPFGQCASAAISVQDITTLTVRWAQLKGAGIFNEGEGCDTGIEVLGNGHTVTVEDATITDFGFDAIYANNVDSIAIRRSNLSANAFSGVDVDAYIPLPAPPQGPVVARTAVTPASTVALVLEDTRLYGNGASAVWADNLRSAAFARNVTVTGVDASFLRGHNGTGSVSFSGDSIRMVQGQNFCDGCACIDNCAPPAVQGAAPAPAFTLAGTWINADSLDAVTIQGMRVSKAGFGVFQEVGSISVSNSSFLDISTTAFSVLGDAQTVIAMDSVHITGDQSCFQCTEGLTADNATSTVNRLRAENLDEGIYHGDGALTVTNSVFHDVYYPIFGRSNFNNVQRLVVQGVTITGATYYGIESDEMVTVVDNSTLSGDANGSEGIYTHGAGADTVRTTTVSDFDYGIDPEDDTAYVAGNTVLRTRYAGIYLSGPVARVESNTIQHVEEYGIQSYVDSLQARGNLIEDVNGNCDCSLPGGIAVLYATKPSIIAHNTLRRIQGSGIGIEMDLDTVTAFVDTNAVSQASDAAVQVYTGHLVMRRNNIRNNPTYGLYNQSYQPSIVSDNAFKGNQYYAVYYSCDCSTHDFPGNWWGLDGAHPNDLGADAAYPVIDSSPLLSEPAVPALAPPIFAARAAASAPAPATGPARVRGVRPTTALTPLAAAPRAIPANLPPAVAAARADREARRAHTLQALAAAADSLRAAPAHAESPRRHAKHGAAQ